MTAGTATAPAGTGAATTATGAARPRSNKRARAVKGVGFTAPGAAACTMPCGGGAPTVAIGCSGKGAATAMGAGRPRSKRRASAVNGVGFAAGAATGAIARGAGSPYALLSRLLAQAAVGDGAAETRGGGKLAHPPTAGASISRRSTLLSRIWHIRTVTTQPD